jgi:hypothetical protein
MYVWFLVNVVGSNAMARHASHTGFACASSIRTQEPHAKTMDGGDHWSAMVEHQSSMMSLEFGAPIRQSMLRHWSPPPELCLRACSLDEIDAYHPSSPSYAACQRSTRDDWSASFLTLGNTKQLRCAIGFFLLLVLYNCVRDRHVDLTDMFEKRAHGVGEKNSHPPTSVSNGISTPT